MNPGSARGATEPLAAERLAAERIAPFVRLALDCVHRPYPNQIAHRLESDSDLALPRDLTPVFYGCYDWHSAVHGHWLLVRAVRLFPRAEFVDETCVALERSLLQPELIAAEVAYLRGRPAFERPYGLAWLLQLHAELRETLPSLAMELDPLVAIARQHLMSWLPKLTHPSRVGTHAQSAFAMGLIHDWATSAATLDGWPSDDAMRSLVESRALDYFGSDRDYPLHLEPSGEDFLSPSLGAADLMRRVMPRADFAEWYERVFPSGIELSVAQVSDKADGRLAHLDGLNLSRAWMLEGIGQALDRSELRDLAEAHAAAGLAAADGSHYAGGHWLGTFATYLLTGRGLGPAS